MVYVTLNVKYNVVFDNYVIIFCIIQSGSGRNVDYRDCSNTEKLTSSHKHHISFTVKWYVWSVLSMKSMVACDRLVIGMKQSSQVLDEGQDIALQSDLSPN